MMRDHVYNPGAAREPVMNSRDVIKRLQAEGWTQVGQTGSHLQFKHPAKPGRVTVPHPRRDLKIGTLKSIARQAGICLP